MNGDLPPPWSADRDGARLTVRVTPRASRSEIAGLAEIGEGRSALAVRLRAPPVDGAANQALVEFLAEALGVTRGAVRLVAGDRSRLKTVRIAGLPVEELPQRLRLDPA